MSLSLRFSWTFSRSQGRRRHRRSPATTSSHRRHTARPGLETLETRLTLSLTTLATFVSTSGDYRSLAGLVTDGSGNLYGTTALGGA